ncbi:MAG: DUF3471 domain-containing protein [Acidobacteriota bacterium]
MRRRNVLGSSVALVALFLAAMPLQAGSNSVQEQELSLDKLIGDYEFEVPEFGPIVVTIALKEEATLTIQSTYDGGPASNLNHVEDNKYKLESSEFGTINIEFFEDEGGNVTSMSIDSYEFSFVAKKKESK